MSEICSQSNSCSTIANNGCGLLFVSWNCRGISDNGTQTLLTQFSNTERPHVICLQETHLDGQPWYVPNYTIYRRDRNSRGGGVALLIRKDLRSRRVTIGNTYAIESVAAEISGPEGKFTVASVYSPRYTPSFKNVLNTIFGVPNIIVMGDLNAKGIAWNRCDWNQAGHALSEFLEDTIVRVLHPTRHTRISERGDPPSTLDFILTNSTSPISQPEILDQLLSDHYAIMAVINANTTKPQQRPNYLKANWVQYKLLLDIEAITITNLPLENPEQIDVAVATIRNSILSARDMSVPLHSVSWEKRDTPPDTMALIREIRRLNRWLNTCSTADEKIIRSLIKNAKSSLKSLSNRDRNARWSKFTGSLNESSKNFWRISKRMRAGPTKFAPLQKPDGTLAIDAEEKVELIADAFLGLHEPGRVHINELDNPIIEMVDDWLVQTRQANSRPFRPISSAEVIEVWSRWRPFKCPGQDGIQNILLKHFPPSFTDAITKIYNVSIAKNYWPAEWRHAKVIALLKKGKPADLAKNYRPIALLPSLSKVLERIIANRLTSEMKEKQILQDWQFGFRPGHSAPQQALRLSKYLRDRKNNKKSSAALFLDVASAFPSMWSKGLLSKLIEDHISNYLVHVINNFLSKRTFSVAAAGAISRNREHSNGEPQGSCLSPPVYAYHVARLSPPRGINPFLYADDTAMVATAKQARALVTNIQKAYTTTVNHYHQWKIKVNTTKTEILWVPQDGKKRRNAPNNVITLDEHDVPVSKVVRYLGVYFDAKLNFATHVRTQFAKANAILSALYPLMAKSSGLSSKNKLLLYKTCVRPVFTYACPVWANVAAKTNLKCLQTLQNRAIKQSLGLPMRISTEFIHDETGLPTVREHMQSLTNRFFEKCSVSDQALIRELARGWNEDG